jgi:competence protein ComEC
MAMQFLSARGQQCALWWVEEMTRIWCLSCKQLLRQFRMVRGLALLRWQRCHARDPSDTMNLLNPLLASVLGWVLGVAWQLQQSALWPLAVYPISLVLSVALGWMAWRVPRWRGWPLWLVVGLLVGAGLTGSRAAIYAARALPAVLEGRDITVTGRIASLPQTTAMGMRFGLAVDSAVLNGQAVTLPERLQLSWFGAERSAGAEPPALKAGERWQLTVRLRQPHGNRNPHGWDRERWLWEQGIGATGYVRSGPRDTAPQRLGEREGYPVLAARQWVSDRIAARVADPRSDGVLAALVVGDQSAIEREDWDLFRTTGVAHLMSISGLHVTMFAWLAMALIGWGWRRLGGHWPGALLAVPTPLAAGIGGVLLAAAYAVFSGWGVPAQRTVLMLAVVVGLRLSGRRWPWPMVWLLAMSAVLLLDPWALLQPGFWLSFVAVGILFATDPGRSIRSAPDALEAASPGLGGRVARSGLGLLREQAVVTVALAPLTLLLFGQFSLVGLAANLIAIPWVTLVITPLAMLGVLLSPLLDLAALAVQGLGLVLAWLGQWPWAAIYRPIPPLGLALAAVLGGVLLVLRLPAVWRAGGVFLLAPGLLWTPVRPTPGVFDVMAIDVGQGSALLVRTAGHSLLFDAGPRYGSDSDAGERVVVPLLRALGERLDAVVISHKDSDHAGGAEAVRATWPQARWLSSFDADPARRCLAGQSWTWDGVRFDILHPDTGHFRVDGSAALSSNAMSCTLRISAGDQSAWLSGDLDAERETRLSLAQPELRATLLIAPHHGSKSSSSPVLLNTLRPQTVLVQSGYRNRFGHPAPEVLDRYRERGLRWVNSPDCGAATWRSDQPKEVRCERKQYQRYWHHRSSDGGGSRPGENAPDTQ